MGQYILENGVPKCMDTEPKRLLKWGAWMECAERRVALTTVGDAVISTVFLGLDHSWGKGDKPVLWETMIFCYSVKQILGDGARYRSIEEATKGHFKLVERAREFFPDAVPVTELFDTRVIPWDRREKYQDLLDQD